MILKFSDPECVMVRIHKTGTTSIINGIFKNQQPVRRHKFVPVWRRLFSFAFVRNPYDRLVSAYLMFRPQYKQNLNEELTIEGLLNIIQNSKIKANSNGFLSHVKRHVIPMTSDYSNIQYAKHIYKFEQFAEEYAKLAMALNVTIKTIPHKLKSKNRRHYREYFDDRLLERATNIFSTDLKQFDYTF